MTLRRLKNDWKSMLLNPPPLYYIEPINNENLFHWNAIILGPPESSYRGTAIFLEISTKDYPFKPPRVKFIFPIYHPNINEEGNICADILGKKWSPAITLPKVLNFITSILSNPLLIDEIPLNQDAANMYNDDRKTYNLITKSSCQNHFSNPEYQQLYFKFYFWRSGFLRNKLLTYSVKEKRKEIIKEDLCYPNDKLNFNIEIFEKEAFTFLPPKIMTAYKTSRDLYDKIVAAENDTVEWVKALNATGDAEFVENNVEYRLCNDLKNKQLWELHFQFLKEKGDGKKLLQMYSLYCRFFPYDFNILEEYIKAVKERPSLVPWKNPFDFEIFDEQFLFASPSLSTPPLPSVATTEETSPPESIQQSVQINIETSQNEEQQSITCCYFNPSNILRQNFPFKAPMLNYILKNLPQHVTHKLHQTCKYFFIQLPTPICYCLEIIIEPTTENKIEFKEASAFITNELPVNSTFQNIKISTILTIEKNEDEFRLSKCLLNIIQCNAKYISISNQILTKKELCFLIDSKNVVELKCWDTRIFCSDGNEIMLEEIMILTPKIRKLYLEHVNSNPETAKLISTLLFTNKIEMFYLYELAEESLEPYAFADFIEKNAAKNCTIILEFLMGDDEEYDKNFNEIVKSRIIKKWTKSERPDFSVYLLE